MTIPIVCRGKCSANVCPHTVIHVRSANNKVFFQLHSDTSLKLAFVATIYCSFPISIKEKTPILPILALLVNRTRFP